MLYERIVIWCLTCVYIFMYRDMEDHQQRSGDGSNAPPVHSHEYDIDDEEVQRPIAEPVIRNYKELRKLGATDFYGTVDPAEAETWKKRTERVFTMMRCSPEVKFDYVVSLLQADAYDWWETVPRATIQPPVLTWEDFQREFCDKYMPEIYRDEKQREFLNLK